MIRSRIPDGPIPVFMDTSGYFAFASPIDANHEEASRLVRVIANPPYQTYTTELVLAEVHTLVRTRLRQRGRQFALLLVREVLATIRRSAVIVEPVLDSDSEQAVTTLFEFPDQEISYTDAISFAVMRRLGIAYVFSFDDDFAVAGFTNIRYVL